ncbi:MAG: hypothetical protein WC052_05175 [Patescibacteria group bacterium]
MRKTELKTSEVKEIALCRAHVDESVKALIIAQNNRAGAQSLLNGVYAKVAKTYGYDQERCSIDEENNLVEADAEPGLTEKATKKNTVPKKPAAKSSKK